MSSFAKRFFAVLLCAALLLLPACAAAGDNAQPAADSSPAAGDSASPADSGSDVPVSEPDSGDATVIELWSFHQDAEAEALAAVGPKYGEHIGQDITVNYTEIAWDDYMGTKLTTAFASGEGPDMFTTCPPQLARYVSAGIAMPLDDYFTDEMKNDFLPDPLAGVTINDQIYSIPIESELLGLYYDVDLFAAEGLEPPKTWEELKTVASQLKTETRAGLTTRIANESAVAFHWLPFVWMAGGDVMDVENRKSLLDSQEVIDALQLYHDLMESGALNAKPSRNPDEIGILCDGETAMQFGGSWCLSQQARDYPDYNLGLVPYPTKTEGGNTSSAAGGWQMVANAKSKHADLVAKMITWAWAEDTAIPLNWGTDVKFAYSPRTSVMAAGGDFYSQGLRNIFTTQISGTEKPELRAPAEIYKIITDMIQYAMYEADGETAAMEAHTQLQEFLDEYEDVI